MKLHEMDGFLKGKCLPGDMLVNETNAEYLVRKFAELQSALDVQSARSEALAVENANIKNFRSVLEEIKSSLVGGGHGHMAATDMQAQNAVLDVVFDALDDIKTPATDAWVNEQRDAILDATFEAAKQEVERRFGRTFQDCAWLARRNSDTQMKGAVEMAEWVELYAAQLRGSQV
ncbi:hypothetical protein [Atlantibacter subterraneus]|uniref:hypothetical protein n=1 Tax=Atlantibacter subterraneus TaxID=255519 RepID=UPI00289A01F6|nr:hypothetical protein [Atlantibacter subterranea]